MKKVALITGASSGIGKDLAIIHAKNAGDLVLVARRVDKLNELKKELEEQYSVEVTVFEKDLSKIAAATELYDLVKSEGIEVDYLINNAGFGLLGKFHELTWQRQSEMISLNITALTELSYLFLADFVERNSGKILNTSSSAGLLPGPLQAVYFASKAYVNSFGNALAGELHDTNITVTTLMPGATETEFSATSGTDKTKMFDNAVTSLSVAQDGYDAMMKGKLDVISGLNFAHKMMIKMIPFTPKKMLLKNVREIQEL